jgi:hypothetical protein
MSKCSPNHTNMIRILLNHPTYIMKKVYGHLEFEFGLESVYQLDRIDIVITNTVTGKHQRRIMTEVTTLLQVAMVVHGYMEDLLEEDRVSIQTILGDITAFITNFKEDDHVSN